MALTFTVRAYSRSEPGGGRRLRHQLAFAGNDGDAKNEAIAFFVGELIARGEMSDGSDAQEYFDDLSADEVGELIGECLPALFAEVADAVDPPSARPSPSGRRGSLASSRRGGQSS